MYRGRQIFLTSDIIPKIVMYRVIWYHLRDLKNVKNGHGGVLLLVKLQASAGNFTISNTAQWVFFTILNCTNGTKSRNVSLLKAF